MTIKNKLMSIIGTITFVSLLFLGGYITYSNLQENKKTIIQNIEENRKITANSLSGKFLEFSDKITTVSQIITSEKDNRKKVVETMNMIASNYKDINGVFILYNDGKIYASDGIELDNSFDYRQRDWFINATSKVQFTEPYEDKQTGAKIITITKKCDGFVIGFDLDISILINTLVSNSKVGKYGYSMLVIRDTIIATKDESLISKKLSDVRYTDKNVHNYFQTELPNFKGWSIYSVLDLKKETRYIRNKSIRTIVVFILTAVCISFWVIYYVIKKLVIHPVDYLIEHCRHIESGNLNNSIFIDRKDEMGILADKFNDMRENLKGKEELFKATSDEVALSSNSVASSINETTAQSETILQNIEQISSSTEELSSYIQKMNETIIESVSSLKNIENKTVLLTQASREMKGEAENGNETGLFLIGKVKENYNLTNSITNSVNELKEKIEEATKFTDKIEDIASTTSLLGLNATIESAKAGEYGRGFAVVASEISKLAKDSEDSSREVKEILSSVGKSMHNTLTILDTMNDCSKTQKEKAELLNVSFSLLVKNIFNVQESINEINLLTIEINKEQNGILEKITDLTANSEENTASIQEIQANMSEQVKAMEEISKVSEQLDELSSELKKVK